MDVIAVSAGPGRPPRDAGRSGRRAAGRGPPGAGPGRRRTGSAAGRPGQPGPPLTTFADSSALVRWYADEVGHEDARYLRPLVVSGLASVEVPSAIWRKYRLGELDAPQARPLVEAFVADLGGEPGRPAPLLMVGLPMGLLDLAARLTAVHGLPALDAVQVASACLAREADPGCDAFACSDRSLRGAAAAEAFRLVPHHLPAPKRAQASRRSRRSTSSRPSATAARKVSTVSRTP